MMFYILISPPHHRFIQRKVVMLSIRPQIFLRPLYKAVETGCRNIYLHDSKRDCLSKISIRYPAASVEHKWYICLLMNFLQYIKRKFGSRRVIAVCISNGNCQCINPRALTKQLCILRIGTADPMVAAAVLTSAYQSQFCFHSGTILSGRFHNFLCAYYIFFKRIRGTVKHD